MATGKAGNKTNKERKYTRIGDHVYDITDFLETHPGGRDLLSLAVGRDATVMFDTYHFRRGVVTGRLASLPVTTAVQIPKSDYPYPSQSPLFNAIQKRVIEEIKEPLRGNQLLNICIIVATTLLVYYSYVSSPSILLAAMLGFVGSWLGLTFNHAGNHGSLTTNPTLNFLFGFSNDLIGGSSLVWRYHHHVSHHAYTNDPTLDQDVKSSYPLIRLDETQGHTWYHKYQYIYCWFLFPFLWFSVHIEDLKAYSRQETFGTKFAGVTPTELSLLLFGKALHFLLLVVLPAFKVGLLSSLFYYAVYGSVGSMILSLLFIVSHNTPETKSAKTDASKDWAVMNIEHSCSWGGELACWFTGGLNLQIEHHVFPSANPMLYPKLAKIIREECEKRKVRYSSYPSLIEVIDSFMKFVKIMGKTNQ